MRDIAVFIGIVFLVVLFAGTPDLMDAIIANLMPAACEAVTAEG